jgi:hypothetical protein
MLRTWVRLIIISSKYSKYRLQADFISRVVTTSVMVMVMIGIRAANSSNCKRMKIHNNLGHNIPLNGILRGLH